MSVNYSQHWDSLVSTVEIAVKTLHKRNKTRKFQVADLKFKKTAKEFEIIYFALDDPVYEVQVAISGSFVNLRIFDGDCEKEISDHFQLKTNKKAEPQLKNLHTGENLSLAHFADYLLRLILKPQISTSEPDSKVG